MADRDDDDARFDIWQETTSIPGGYLPTIGIGGAAAVAPQFLYEVTPDLAAELTRYLTDVLLRGVSEAALSKSFRARDISDEVLGAMLGELRENYPAVKSPIAMSVYQGVSLFTGEAFFTVQFDGCSQRGQWSAPELRKFIGEVNELVSTGQWDNFVFRQLTDVIGMDEHSVRAIIHSVGEHK